MRKRILASAAALALLAACGDSNGSAGAADPSGPAASTGVTVSVTESDLGAMLVDGSGRTLYLFTVDEPGVSNCDADCLAAWPPLLTDGEPVAAGTADPALIGTLSRADGTVQVTYAGWPLYFFAADAAPGDVNGQGVNGVWFVVAPDGTATAEAGDTMGDTPDDAGMGSSPSDMDMGGGGSYGY